MYTILLYVLFLGMAAANAALFVQTNSPANIAATVLAAGIALLQLAAYLKDDR